MADDFGVMATADAVLGGHCPLLGRDDILIVIGQFRFLGVSRRFRGGFVVRSYWKNDECDISKSFTNNNAINNKLKLQFNVIPEELDA